MSKTKDNKFQPISIHPVKFVRQLFNRVNIARKASKYLSVSVISLVIFFGLAGRSEAANWYVRPSGGTGSGTNWTAAWNGMNGINWDSVSCGDTIWIAGGTYTQRLNPAKVCTSGSQLYINIRRARSDASECTAATGWSSSFDSTIAHNVNGTAIYFDGTNNYMTISGRTKSSGGNYGWVISRPGITTGKGIEFANNSNSNYVTLEYMEVAGPDNPQNATDDLRGIDGTPLNGSCCC